MKIRLKGFLCIVILLAMVASIVPKQFINASNEEDMGSQESLREYLSEVGTPPEVVDKLSDTAVNNIYAQLIEQAGEGMVVEFGDYEEQVFPISDTSNSGNQLFGSISSDTLKLSITWYNLKQGNVIRQVDAYANYCWLRNPFYCRTDSLTFNWNSDLFSLSSFNSYDLLTGPTQYYLTNQQTRPSQANIGGVGWYAKLGIYAVGMGEWGGNPNHVEGGATLRFIPRIPINTSSATTGQFTMNYVHNKGGIGTSISFNLTGASVGISAKGSYDDAATTSLFSSYK